MAFVGGFDAWFRGAPFLRDSAGDFSVWFRGAPVLLGPEFIGLDFLSTDRAALYTCPAATRAVVLNVILVNTDVAQRKVNLYLTQSGGTPRQIIPVDTQLGAKYQLVEDRELALAPADKIEGKADAGGVVSALVNKIEMAA